MSKDLRDFWGSAACLVFLVLIAIYGITFAFSHFHDWDCSKHGGLLNPNGVYSVSNAQSNTPGTVHVQVDATTTVCKDGYRP